MKHLTFFSAFFIFLLSQGNAQNTNKKERIKTLFIVMRQDSLIEKTMDITANSIVNNMTKIYKDSMYIKMGVDVTDITQKILKKTMQRSKAYALRLLNEDMVDIYDKYFTIEEIEDFITFYKSNSGQKMLMQTPGITKDYIDAMTSKYQSEMYKSISEDMQEIALEVVEQMKSKEK